MSSERASRFLRLCIVLYAVLFSSCATRVARPQAERPWMAVSIPPARLERLEEALRSPDLTEEERYLYLSAHLGLARSSGRFIDSDRVLEQLRASAPQARLTGLAGLWWADNALYAGHFEEAERRYRALLNPVSGGRARGGDVYLLGYALREWIELQLGTAMALQGRYGEAAGFLEAASIRATGLVEIMRTRAELIAWDAGDRALRKRLQERLSSSHPARSRLSSPPPVRPLEALQLKAPWEPGVHQRAGAVGPGVKGYLRFGLNGLRYGTSDSPCGAAAGGYFYDAGSHSHRRAQSRDRYAIDFSAPGRTRARWGKGSFGIQIRASAEGIAGQTYYGTRTHRGVRARGPIPPNNKVLIYHTPPGPSRVDLVLGATHRRRVPGVLYPGIEIYDAWDYQTAYHHLVGLEAPCPGDPKRDRPAGRCIPFPALISTGQYVWRGTPLGYEDSTGLSMMDHLHFQINQSCREGGADCPRGYRHRRAGLSVPVHLEGRRLQNRDMGLCLESTNQFELILDDDGDGLPDVLRPDLPPAPVR